MPPELTPQVPVPSFTAPEPTQGPMAPAQPAHPTVLPTRLLIPSIGVDSREFMSVGLDEQKQLQTPTLRQPKTIAWYKGSPIPGESATCTYDQGCTQPSVMNAHINANGVAGAFAKLATVKDGAKIAVSRSDGRTAHFTVTKVLIVPKKDFPTGTVYGAPGTSLVLVTCGPTGLERSAAGGNYTMQTIVIAKLTSTTRNSS